MKIVISILGLLTGVYMLIDGIYVLLKGKYIGPARPGPWSKLFDAFSINVFRLGPLFIAYGILWLVWLYMLWTKQSNAYWFGLTISFMTLWYLPVGTLFSLAIIAILFFGKSTPGNI